MRHDKLKRGEVVLATDPYSGYDGRRPFVVVSNDEYPFYPRGYLGVPLTRRDKSNTVELERRHLSEVWEEFEKDDNFINPWSPVQVNDWGRSLCLVSESFMDGLAYQVAEAVGCKKA